MAACIVKIAQGPRMDLCGTPQVRWAGEEKRSPIMTKKELFVKEWFTVSKAALVLTAGCSAPSGPAPTCLTIQTFNY